jgi:hypothetical protein
VIARRDDFDRQVGGDFDVACRDFRQPLSTPVRDIRPTYRVGIAFTDETCVVRADRTRLAIVNIIADTPIDSRATGSVTSSGWWRGDNNSSYEFLPRTVLRFR